MSVDEQYKETVKKYVEEVESIIEHDKFRYEWLLKDIQLKKKESVILLSRIETDTIFLEKYKEQQKDYLS